MKTIKLTGLTAFTKNQLSRVVAPLSKRVGIAISASIALLASHAAEAAERPNFKPYKPNDWSSPLEIRVNDDDGTVRVDWAVINIGKADASKEFRIRLYLDGDVIMGWRIPSLRRNYYVWLRDVQLPKSLTNGNHTLELRADATNAIRESNEDDNRRKIEFEVDEVGSSLEKGKLSFPLPDKATHHTITHGFGRDWDANKKERKHSGIDMRAPAETEFYAVAKGTVLDTGEFSDGWKGWIVVGHDKDSEGNYGWTSCYIHTVPSAIKGQEVEAGEKLGKVAYLTTGSHLHLSIRLGPAASAKGCNFGALAKPGYGSASVPEFPEKYVNPLDYLDGDFTELD